MTARRSIGSELSEETSFPGAVYAAAVLQPAYDNAKRELLEPMMAVHKAHLIMLFEQGLVREQETARIAAALERLNLRVLKEGVYTGRFEDLFFEVEHRLYELDPAAGNLHLARSRNDMGIAIYRIVLREKLLSALDAALELHATLRSFAEKHVSTLMIAHTHTQQAQPTTLGHYIAAVADSLSRDIRRLLAAYDGCNRSSMGAAALTTSGFAISRERIADLLGFDELIENAYDAVSGSDYIGETASAVQLAATGLGRFVQELLLWCMQEFGVARVAAPYVQVSSIMPQKRNPVSVEHARSLLSSAVGDAQTVLSMMHNTPFGDIVDTEDDMQPYAWRSLGTLEAVYRLLARVVATLEIDEQTLRRRAENSFAVVTELADTLVRREGLPFRTAHAVVSRLVETALAAGGRSPSELSLERLREAAAANGIDRLRITETELRQALDPDHFVQVRDLPGGPARTELERALRVQSERHAEQRRSVEQRRRAVSEAWRRLEVLIAAQAAHVSGLE
ncbi:argininosuccinate lyase [Paenibacillus sp. NPDC058071]|uniref:argininosuccinate lyase n=1 Tax=Paenibacillus sp. NPDC058071 TaxID=3346326 RepID=UPI0036D88689